MSYDLLSKFEGKTLIFADEISQDKDYEYDISNDQLLLLLEYFKGNDALLNYVQYFCKIGRLDLLKMTFEYLSDGKLVEAMECSLCNAIKSQSMDIVDFILDECKFGVTRENVKPQLELHPPTYPRKMYHDPLFTALETGNIDFVRRILDAGGDPHKILFGVIRKYGTSGPMWDLILMYGVNINFVSGSNTVFTVCKPESIDTLIQLGADINMVDEYEKRTALESLFHKFTFEIREMNDTEIRDFCNIACQFIRAGATVTTNNISDTLRYLFNKYNIYHEDIKHLLV